MATFDSLGTLPIDIGIGIDTPVIAAIQRALSDEGPRLRPRLGQKRAFSKSWSSLLSAEGRANGFASVRARNPAVAAYELALFSAAVLAIFLLPN